MPSPRARVARSNLAAHAVDRGDAVGSSRAVGLLLGVLADSVVGDPGRKWVARPRAGAPETGAPETGAAEAATSEDGPSEAGASDPVVGGPRAGSGLRRMCHRLPAGSRTAAAVVTGVAVERVGRRWPALRVLGTASATWAALGAARMVREGSALARCLETGDADGARTLLAGCGSRRVGDLPDPDLARVSVEKVAADTVDSVVTPLLWGAVAGVPGLLGARAVNLERARIVGGTAPGGSGVAAPGRRGWWLLRVDGAVALLPTRVAAALTGAAAPVVGGSARAAWRAWRRDTVLHPGPNTGRVEAAFAGALGVRLGGRTVHPHGPRELPVLGEGRTPDAGQVTRAVELSRVVGWLAAALTTLLALRPRPHRRAPRESP